jgi:hypothetical protein
MKPSGIEPAQCLNQLRHRVPLLHGMLEDELYLYLPIRQNILLCDWFLSQNNRDIFYTHTKIK